MSWVIYPLEIILNRLFKRPAMGPGKGKTNMTVHVTDDLRDFVAARGAVHDWSASKYARRIIQWWVATGAPAVCEQDMGKNLPDPGQMLFDSIDDWWPLPKKQGVSPSLHSRLRPTA